MVLIQQGSTGRVRECALTTAGGTKNLGKSYPVCLPIPHLGGGSTTPDPLKVDFVIPHKGYVEFGHPPIKGW